MNKIDKDTIVYWITNTVNGWQISFGIVDEIFPGGVNVARLVPRNRLIIDGIPIHEYKFGEKWYKLPKGWSYDTVLCKLETEPFETKDVKLPCKCLSNEIKELLDKGVLVKACVEPYWQGHVNTKIEHGEYMVIWEYPQWSMKSAYMYLRYNEVFLSYQEAQNKIDEITAENNRVANLTDREYNIEKMEQLLDKLKGLYSYTDEDCNKIRNKLLDMKDFDDLEFRISCSNFQFKHWKKKKWMGVIS